MLRFVLSLVLLLFVGCPQAPSGGAASPAPVVPLTPAEEQEVMLACARCHKAPEPSALPKARWAEVIPTMIAMPLPAGQKALTEKETALALRHYAAKAPEALPRAPQAKALSETLRFKRESFLPRSREFLATRAPAVSNLSFVPLSDSKKLDLLICEMRSQGLFLLPAWAPKKQRRVLSLARKLNYPARVNLVDLDQDTRKDFLVSSLGDMNPTNAESGGVTWLRQDAKRKFKPHAIGAPVGRATDARAADFDGDEDLDLVVCAFGWRGPGKLILLTNQGGSPPKFVASTLDARDGYIHAIPHDLDEDGDLDIVGVIAQHYEKVVWLRNDGGKFTPIELYAGPHPAWGSSGLELADMDKDGDLDLLVSNGDTLDDRLLKPYHGVGYLEVEVKDKTPSVTYRRVGDLYGCEAATASDLDGDGDLDVVAVSFAPQLDPSAWAGVDSVVWFERTPGAWKRHSLEQGKCVHPCVAVADYDDNGKPDIAVGNYVWIGEGDRATFQADFVTLFTAD